MSGEDGAGSPLRRHAVAVLVLGAALLGAVAMIGFSLRRPAVEGVAPTATAPHEVGAALVGPVRYTVNATDADRWTFFDFSRGAVVPTPGPLDWDLAFRRFRIIANGGRGFAGRGALADLGEVPFDTVRSLAGADWIGSDARGDSSNAATARWYAYGFTSHLLRPKPNVYAVRTADGRLAWFRLLNYYCPGATPGCVSFEYVYRGDLPAESNP